MTQFRLPSIITHANHNTFPTTHTLSVACHLLSHSSVSVHSNRLVALSYFFPRSLCNWLGAGLAFAFNREELSLAVLIRFPTGKMQKS
jgi:hypothetical protein